jgi:WD40 repeat protein
VDQNVRVCLWDLANGREIPFMGPPLLHGWHNLAFYPDNDHLTFVTARGMAESWDTRTARRVCTLGQPGEFEGMQIAATRDGRWLATDPEPPTIALWNSQAGSRVFSLPQESGGVWSLAWSPEGQRLAAGLANGGLAIWDLPKVQAQLAQIGLAWRADAQPPRQEEPQPFFPRRPMSARTR